MSFSGSRTRTPSRRSRRVRTSSSASDSRRLRGARSHGSGGPCSALRPRQRGLAHAGARSASSSVSPGAGPSSRGNRAFCGSCSGRTSSPTCWTAWETRRRILSRHVGRDPSGDFDLRRGARRLPGVDPSPRPSTSFAERGLSLERRDVASSSDRLPPGARSSLRARARRRRAPAERQCPLSRSRERSARPVGEHGHFLARGVRRVSDRAGDER